MGAPLVCSCGDPKAHPITERRTADGVKVQLWSDGDLTVGGYRQIIARKLTPEMRAEIAGWIECYDRAELRDFVRSVRRKIQRSASVQA